MAKVSRTIIGIDTHIGNSNFFAMDEKSGDILGVDRFRTNPTNYIKAVIGLPKPRIVIIEQGPMAEWVKRILSRHADEVIISETKQNSWIAKDPNKNDTIDAEKLARLYLGGYLKPIISRSHEKEELITLVIHYFSLIKQIVRVKNQMSAKFRQVGRQKKGERLFKDLVIADELVYFKYLPAMLHSVSDYHEQLRLLRRQLNRLLNKMQRISSKFPEIELLRRFSGIGLIGSITLCALIDIPERFATVKRLWIYCGYGLDRQRSGNRIGYPRITKRGNRMLKYVIGIAVNSIISRCRSGRYKEWYKESIANGKDPRKAKACLARKLIKDIWIQWRLFRQQEEKIAA